MKTNEEKFPETIRVDITFEDMDNEGGYSSNKNCLVATALKRMYPEFGHSVGGFTITRYDGEVYGLGVEYRVYDFPEGIDERIIEFYEEDNRDPFSFVAERR